MRSTKVATVVDYQTGEALETAPDDDTTYQLLPPSGATVTGAVTVGAINADVIDEQAIASNAITAAKIGDGAFTAAKFASGAFDAVWTVASRLLTSGANIVLAKGTGITGLNDPTPASVASSVASIFGVTPFAVASSGSTAAVVRTDRAEPSGAWDASAIVVRVDGVPYTRKVASYAEAGGAMTLDEALPGTPDADGAGLLLGRIA